MVFTLYWLKEDGFSDDKPCKLKLKIRFSLLVCYHFIIKSANLEALLLLLPLVLPAIIQKLYCIHINLYLRTDTESEIKALGRHKKLPFEFILPSRNCSQAASCPGAQRGFFLGPQVRLSKRTLRMGEKGGNYQLHCKTKSRAP